jgi:signal transduction histidine kinase
MRVPGSRTASRIWLAMLLRRRLGRRILLWFLVLSLMPLLVSNTTGYLVTRRIIETRTGRYLLALTEMDAEHVATEVERHKLYLDAVVAGNEALSQGVPAASAAVARGLVEAPSVTGLEEHLDSKLSELHTLTELVAIGPSGTVVAATRRHRVGADWSRRDAFLFGQDTGYFKEAWEMFEGEMRPLYRLATPIYDAEGRGVGVLAASVEFDMLQDFLRIPPHLAGDVHTFIVGSDGHPLFVSHAHIPIDYQRQLAPVLLERPAGTTARYFNYEGVEVFGTSVAVPGLDWLFISEVSVDSAIGQLRGLALLAAALETLFALLLVGIVWLVARSIVAPLRRLVVAAERIRRGELGVEVKIDREDELGDLGHTFNQMSGELQASASRIQELHDQEMRRAAQLASVGELASGIAHEIKNPLVGLSSGLDLLRGQVRENKRANNILCQMRAQVDRMESAIRDLLSYARPKQPRYAWSEPEQLVDRVIGLVRSQAEAAGVRIEVEQDGEASRVRVDPELITQALVNLALNGIQAMSEGGVLTMKIACPVDQVRISVSDTGKGIPQKEISEIFRPFHTSKHQGTGLGLTITRAIVERHSGHLDVESIPGEGSRFTLVLSAVREEAVPG